MAHIFQPAPSARSKCRGCGQVIQRGELRFGESMPNPFGGGEMTLWFHPLCAAYKLPQPMSEGLEQTTESVPDLERLKQAVLASVMHTRIPRIDGAEKAPSGQAKCRCCHETIEKGSWRVRIVFYEEGRFAPGGSVHLGCRNAYFETGEVLEPILRFSPDLSEEERAELVRAFDAA
jgi:hypothetical protein